MSMLQQIFDLLTLPPGNLAYHLVLAFSILGALQMVFLLRGDHVVEDTRPGRLVAGLVGLLLLQLAQFVISGFAWQGLIEGDFWLPPVDRIVMLLSLVIIIWLWLFPEKTPRWDAATSIFAVLIIAGMVYSVYWWRFQYPVLAYNHSWADYLINLTAIIYLGAGAVLIALRRPDGWLMGMVMFFMLALGPVYHMIFPINLGAYSGAVRAAQLAAYPLLFLLSHRLHHERPLEVAQYYYQSEIQLDPDAPAQYVNSDTWQALSELAQMEPSIHNANRILSTLARLAQAESCLLVFKSSQDENIIFQTGLEPETGQESTKVSIDIEDVPLVFAALENGITDRLPVNANSLDSLALAEVFNLEVIKDILYTPLRTLGEATDHGILLLFSESLTNLSARQYAALLDLITFVAYILQHNLAVGPGQTTAIAIPQTTNLDLRIALEEIDHLRAGLAEAEQRLANMQENASQIQSFAQDIERIDNILQDIRQPIQSVTSNAETLIKEGAYLNESQRKRLERIKISTERLTRLVSDLSQTISPETRVENLTISEVNINNLLARIVGEVNTRIAARKIVISKKLPASPMMIATDFPTLEKILKTIIQNAADVSPDGGTVHVQAAVERIEGSPDFVLVQVTDSGGGIDLSDVSSRFNPPGNHRNQLEKLGKNGLDFLVLKALASTLGGSIWIDNEPGHGTVYSVLIPTEMQPDPRSSRKATGSV